MGYIREAINKGSPMSKKFTETHLLNPDQTDPFGQITMATIFRYMQSAATNYAQDMPELQKIDRNDERQWLIYYSQVELKNLITYNNKIDITTWLDDYKKSIARRKYLLQDQQTGQQIATAFTDWIYFDRKNLRPVSVDPLVDQILFQDTPPQQDIKRIKLKSLDPQKPVIENVQPITLRHLDINHHVNNTVYIDFFLNSFSLAHDTLGIDLNQTLAQGLSWISTHYEIQYNLQAKIGEQIRILAQVEQVSSDQVLWVFEIKKPDTNKPVTIAKVTYQLWEVAKKSFTAIPEDYQKTLTNYFKIEEL